MTFYIDGGCSNSNQKDQSKREMVCVVFSEIELVSEENEIGGSNNIAELLACRNALRYASKQGFKEVNILTDSQNTIAWFKKFAKNRKINDIERVWSIQRELEYLKTFFDRINIQWIPREKNLAGFYIEAKYRL